MTDIRTQYEAARARRDHAEAKRLWTELDAAAAPVKKSSHGCRAGQRQARDRDEERREAIRCAADRRFR